MKVEFCRSGWSFRGRVKLIYEGDIVVLINGIDGVVIGRNLDDGEEKLEECVRKVLRVVSEMILDIIDSFFVFIEFDIVEC